MKVTSSSGTEYKVAVTLRQVAEHTYVIRATLSNPKSFLLSSRSPPFLIDDYHSVYEEYLVKVIQDTLRNSCEIDIDIQE